MLLCYINVKATGARTPAALYGFIVRFRYFLCIHREPHTYIRCRACIIRLYAINVFKTDIYPKSGAKLLLFWLYPLTKKEKMIAKGNVYLFF